MNNAQAKEVKEWTYAALFYLVFASIAITGTIKDLMPETYERDTQIIPDLISVYGLSGGICVIIINAILIYLLYKFATYRVNRKYFHK